MGVELQAAAADTLLTLEQEQAAEWLAQGVRKGEVARRLQIAPQRLWEWAQIPEFGDYAVSVREGLRAECLVQAAALMRAVLEIDTAVIEGRMDADDPRAKRAAAILDSAGDHFAYDSIRHDAANVLASRSRRRTVNQ